MNALPQALVFYGGLLYGEMSQREVRSLAWDNLEIYNGAYVYNTHEREWYRCDGVPVLLEDVPPALRMQVLVMT